MPKLAVFSLALVVIIFVSIATLVLNNFGQKKASRSEIDAAINQARLLYRQERQRGRDLSAGPCISNALMPGWVVDIVHNPRLPIDDLPENQCSAYLEGRAQHFVELDIDGNLIRTK